MGNKNQDSDNENGYENGKDDEVTMEIILNRFHEIIDFRFIGFVCFCTDSRR